MADLGSGVRLGEDDRVFKVPELPRQAKGKGKEKDVFGDVSEVQRVVTSGNGKQKMGDKGDAGLEKANKHVRKLAWLICSNALIHPFLLGHQAGYHRISGKDEGPNGLDAGY